MGAIVDSVWSFIQQRTDTAYLFIASLLTLATGYGKLFLADELSTDSSISGLSPTLRSFVAASEWLSGHQWPWIQNTSLWLTERSDALHFPAVLLLLGAGLVIGLQGEKSLTTKTSATLLLAWVLVVNTGGMSFGIWTVLVLAFIGGSLRQLKDGIHVCGAETFSAFTGVLLAPLYAVLAIVFWLTGKTRTSASA